MMDREQHVGKEAVSMENAAGAPAKGGSRAEMQEVELSRFHIEGSLGQVLPPQTTGDF